MAYITLIGAYLAYTNIQKKIVICNHNFGIYMLSAQTYTGTHTEWSNIEEWTKQFKSRLNIQIGQSLWEKSPFLVEDWSN